MQDSKSSKESLRVSEKRYQRLFEAAMDGILILDADTGRIVDANPFLLELLGYSYEMLCGKHIWDIGAFKDVAASKEAFNILQDNEYIRYENLPLQTRNGQAKDVEFISNVYLVEDRKVIQCNIRDNSRHRRTAKALEKSEAMIHSILDNIRIGVALISPGMEILELNNQMREWFPTIKPGKGCICYREFNDPLRETLCEYCPTKYTLQDGMVHEDTTHTPQGEGGRNYRIVSSPIFNQAGEVTAVIEMVEDITEKLALESQYLQAQKMEAVGQLAGGVAHDFNNMLSVILGYSEIAMTMVDPTQPLYASLEEIFKAAKSSAEITRQLLTFARKQTIEPVETNLNDEVESMLNMLQRLIGEDIELTWLPGSDLWPIKTDPGQVNQILANLCVNARDAIASVGKLTIKTEKLSFDKHFCDHHAGYAEGDYVQLNVSDNGCGMEKEILNRIFEPFFTSKELGQGTGLGLSTVYGIVKQNNGFIKVFSEPGQGTTFAIHVPRYVADVKEPGQESDAEIPISSGETILLVEDETAFLKMCKTTLENLGYKVLTAGTPEEAIKLACEHASEIHLVIIDVIMPKMNGRDLSEQLRLFQSDMKILFMSGYTADVISQRGLLDEGVNFIQKPFSMKKLAVKVREVL